MKLLPRERNGFTLIELLLVIIIIAVLAVIIFVALNPVKRIKDAHDARRVTDIETILSAVHLYVIDNKGALPAGLSTGLLETQLGTDASGCAVSSNGCLASASACLDMTTPLNKYLKSIPVDPNGTSGKTGYTITVDGNNIVTVKACNAEGGTNISQSR